MYIFLLESIIALLSVSNYFDIKSQLRSLQLQLQVPAGPCNPSGRGVKQGNSLDKKDQNNLKENEGGTFSKSIISTVQ